MEVQKYIFIPIIFIGILLVHYHLNTLKKNEEEVVVVDKGPEIIEKVPPKNIVEETVEKVVKLVKEPPKEDIVQQTKTPEFPVPAISNVSKQLTDIKNVVLKAVGIEQKPLRIIRNRNVTKTVNIPKPPTTVETVSPNPIKSTEYSFVGENTGKAWSEVNVSQHPTYYTSNVKDELTNAGLFFNEKKQFNDITSPQAVNNLPDRCFLNKDNEVLCNFNNRLQNIPPRLIENPQDNKVINSIGQGGGDIFKSVASENVVSVQNNPVQVWEYEDEKVMNGGELYDGVSASSADNEEHLQLTNVPKNSVYSF